MSGLTVRQYIERGEGIQVVKVVEGSNPRVYQLQEEALATVAQRAGSRKVAIISVAGEFRKGKSFMLDFFLRYLYSKYVVRESGVSTWLGSENDPLRGFSWRGGCNRHTTGLLLWSQPIIITLPNTNEEIAILLMDTQGTFDSVSTMRDCCTIFALSMLLSSVQIYNITGNINTDHLNFLQLFTNYGIAAKADRSQDSGKPFQNLKFLVRDWMFEYPFGAEGGRQLLESRLNQIRENEEMDAFRSALQDCFEEVSCFLMPHPGFDIPSNPDLFTLSCIRESFKNSLLELVPSTLDASRLRVKQIGGAPMIASNLVHYFRMYLDVFNSDRQPPVTNIMNATAEASVLSALDNSRQLYQSQMARFSDERTPWVTDAALVAAHREAKREALTAAHPCFQWPHLANDPRFERLEQELERRLQQYKTSNNAKKEQEKRRAETEFNNAIAEVSISMAESFRRVRDINDLNNNAAVTNSRDSYIRNMEERVGVAPCATVTRLQEQHNSALQQAIDNFENSRTRISRVQRPDDYISRLLREINNHFSRLQSMNETSNLEKMQQALTGYNLYMRSICGPTLPCLHPRDLNNENEEARDRAIHEFLRARGVGAEDEPEDDKRRQLSQELSNAFITFRTMNEDNNRTYVNQALSMFCSYMEGETFKFRLESEQFDDLYQIGYNNAMTFFQSKRRNSNYGDNDDYIQDLKQKMDDKELHYRIVNKTRDWRPGKTTTTTSSGEVDVWSNRLRNLRRRANQVNPLTFGVGSAFGGVAIAAGATVLGSIAVGGGALSVLLAIGGLIYLYYKYFLIRT